LRKEILMIKSISQWSFRDGDLRSWMDIAKDAGFEAIELAIDEEGEISLGSSEADISDIREYAERIGLGISSLATGLFWSYPFTSSRPEIREKGIEVALKMLEVASWLGTDAILVVPGAVGVDFIPESEVVPYDVAYERASEALRRLAPDAESKGVCIAVENVWNKFLLSPLEMRDFVDAIGSDYVKVYFDVGNVLLTGYPEHWIRILGNRIKRVHLKDFRRSVGNLNGFVDLLEGDVNWPQVIDALREVGYDSYLTAEMIPPYSHHPEALIYNTSIAMDRILGRK